MRKPIRILIFFLLIATLLSCTPQSSMSQSELPPTAPPLPTPTITAPHKPLSIYYGPGVPEILATELEGWNLPIVSDPLQATLRLEFVPVGDQTAASSKTTWIYALVVPFPTITDGVMFNDVRAAWKTSPPGRADCPLCGKLTSSPLWMTKSTLAAFTALWGEPASDAVKVVPEDQLVDSLWENQPAWGIVPFERLEPRLKVLSVNGRSPLFNDFEVTTYPLRIDFALRVDDRNPVALGLSLIESNRDPSQLTTIVLTGVTSFVRATAYMMETKGITYPARDIGDILRAADITHISNEVPFLTGCDFPNPSRYKLVFCSDPRYVEILIDVGTDVVELTGNHFADYGAGAMLETLDIYNQHGIGYYGGGADLEDASKPLILEHNDNKIAFIGCNPVDLGKPAVATETSPGAAPCDHTHLVETISELNSQGYLVIATFQHQEYYSPEARPGQLEDFHRVADAGASIVSGSQAHFAQMMEFYNDAFIHYGLGNLFFDQMGDIPYHPGIRREFIDRYTVYNGDLISVEILTAMLVDYSRPRPMTPEERASFLNEYFYHSGWGEIVPSPTPQPTLTLTPMILPQPFTTITPVP